MKTTNAMESPLDYEWRTAQGYLDAAKGDHQQAYLDLLADLPLTVSAHRRCVLLNVGIWMQNNWPLRRPIDSEGGEMAQEKTA